MSTIVMTVVVLTGAGVVPAAPGAAGGKNPDAATARLDKTGTAGGVLPGATSQKQVSQPLTMTGSLQAEREGNEPSAVLSPWQSGVSVRSRFASFLCVFI